MKRLPGAAGGALVLAVLLQSGASSAAPPSAAAPPSTSSESAERARSAFERAREAFARQSYAAAAALFEESASHVRHPAPLVNAADAWERAGDYVRSARTCDRVLEMTDLLDPQARALAEATLSRVLTRVATLELEGPAGTTARIDGGEATALPLRIRLAPGPHDIEASASTSTSAPLPPTRMRLFVDPRSVTRRVLTERELATRERLEGPPTAAQGDETRPSALRPPPLLTYVSYGVAALGVGSGLYFGSNTLDERTRWVDTGSLDARSDFYRDRALTNVAFGVALVGAVVGTVVWLRDAR